MRPRGQKTAGQGLLKRIGWFLVLWSGGVASLAAVAFIIRLALAP